MREKTMQTTRAFNLQAFRWNLAFANAVVCAAIGTDDLHSVLTESGAQRHPGSMWFYAW